MELPASQVIGRYTIRSVEGRGAFGTVYRAYDPKLEREVALKVPRGKALSTERRRKRFLEDARAAAGLHHPHIVPVFEVGEEDGQFYIATAFIEGTTLSKEVDRGRFSCERASNVVRKLAEALDYAHSKNVIHRDVKPANVMIDAKGDPYLIDFGLARRHGQAEQVSDRQGAATEEGPNGATDTREGQIIGTPAYMCPEAAQGQSHNPTQAFDQYSLGVILYELLAGEPPFVGPAGLVLSHVCHSMPLPVRTLRADVPVDLEAICHKAMSKRAEDRYGSCQEMADDLRRFLAGEEVKARPQGALEKVRRWAKREPMVVWASGVAVIGVMLAAVLGVLFGLAQWQAAAAFREKADMEQRAAQEAQDAAEQLKAQRDEAVRNEQKAQRQGAEQLFDRGLGMAQQGEIGQALLLFARGTQLAEKAGPSGRGLDKLFRTNLAGWNGQLHSLKSVISTGRAAHGIAVEGQGRGLYVLERGVDKTGCLCLYNNELSKVGEWTANHVRGPRVMAICESSSLMVVSDEDDSVFQWELRKPWATGASRLVGVKGVVSLALSGKGETLVVGTKLGDVVQVALGTDPDKPKTLLKGEPGQAEVQVAISPDGKHVLAGVNAVQGGGSWWLWHNGEEIAGPVRVPAPIHAVALSPRGDRIAVATGQAYQGEVWVWQMQEGKAVSPYAPLRHQAEVFSVCFHPEGTVLLTAGQDRAARTWEVATGRAIGQPLRHPGDVRQARFNQDGKKVFTLCDGDQQGPAVYCWGMAQGGEADRTYSLATGLSAVRSMSVRGKTLLVGGQEGLVGTAHILDIDLKRQVALKVEEGENDPVYATNVTPSGNYLVTGAGATFPHAQPARGMARLWNVDGTLRAEFRHPDIVRSVSVSSDGATVITGCDDATVRVWDTHTPKRPRYSLTLNQWVYCVEISPDDREVFVGGKDRFARILNTRTGEELARWPLPDTVLCCAFDPGNQQRALIGYVGGAQLWAWDQGKPRPMGNPLTHQTYQAGVLSVAISADGETALTAETDGRVWWWSLETNRPLGPPLDHGKKAVAVAACFGTAEFGGERRMFTAALGGGQPGRAYRWSRPESVSAPSEVLEDWTAWLTGLTFENGAVRQLNIAGWKARRRALEERGWPVD